MSGRTRVWRVSVEPVVGELHPRGRSATPYCVETKSGTYTVEINEHLQLHRCIQGRPNNKSKETGASEEGGMDCTDVHVLLQWNPDKFRQIFCNPEVVSTIAVAELTLLSGYRGHW